EREAFAAAARRVSRPRSAHRDGDSEAGSQGVFPAARVPVPLDDLVGRADDLAAVTGLLREPRVRLVTLTGAPGIGKTRLAIAAATEMHRAFPDGVAFVALAAIADSGLVMPGVAQALGVRQGAAQDVTDQIAAALRGRRVLLVLDNFEQILDAGAEVLALLERAPDLSVLVTSRSPLRLRGERRYPLAPFDAPHPDDVGDPDWLSQTPAVTLYAQRAQAVDPDFALTPDNRTAVAAVCHYLDGLPLAIELAAARSAILPPQAMLSKFPGALPLLTGGTRDGPHRHRTLRDAIAWSYGLLTDEEQRLFRALGVFVGGWTLEAAEWVSGDGLQVLDSAHDVTGTGPQPATLDLLAGLVEHNLVRLDHRSGAVPRYAMLETMREFAVAMATERGEMPELRSRHADWYGRMFRGGEMTSWEPRTRQTRQTFNEENGNIRAAFDWQLEANAVEVAGWMVLILIGWLNREARFLEAPPMLRRVMAKSELLSPGLRGLLTANLAYGLYMQNDPSALPMAYRAVAMQRALAGTPDFDPVKLAISIVITGHCSEDPVEQRRLYEEAIQICRGEGEEFWQANALVNLGGAYWETGAWEKAVPAIEEGILLYQQLGTEYGLAYAQTFFANLLRQEQDPHAASEHYCRAIAVFAELGDIWMLAISLEGLAAIAMDRQPAHAAWLYGAAAELRAQCGGEVEPFWWGRTPTTSSDLQAVLGDAAFAEAYDDGKHASLDVMVQVALIES
ncbi:MAG: ATP-binding protein, partial [Thermomicrobiales bacterium]